MDMEWINCNDKLPDIVNQEYLVCRGNKVVVATYRGNNAWHRKSDSGYSTDPMARVTHWMNFPDPPKK